MSDRCVTVGVFYSLPAFVVARSVLAARGVPVHSVGEGLAGVAWPYLVAIGGLELRVPEALEADARALLGEGEPVPLRESETFWARPVWYAALSLPLWFVGLWPIWLRDQRAAKDEAPEF